MARKRKAAAQNQGPSGPAELDPRDARKRIRTYEDVADSDDEFHVSRDEVRLGEDPQSKRQRKWNDQEEFLNSSDEEVLGYSEGESEDEEDAFDDEYGGDQKASEAQTRSRNGHSKNGTEHRRNKIDSEDEEELGWGMSKGDLYGADAIETEEQALEEEAEALRLQRRQLEAMQAADYGFDEAEWHDGQASKRGQEREQDEGIVTEVLPQLQIPATMGAAEKLKLLKSRYPEFDILSKELFQLQDVLVELQGASTSVSLAKFRAVSAYVGALTVYFSLLTSTASRQGSQAVAMPANQLRDHPIMDSLVKCRQLWLTAANLAEEVGVQDSLAIEPEDSGIEDLAQFSGEGEDSHELKQSLEPERTKSRAERFAEAQGRALSAEKAARLQRTEAGLADLEALLKVSSKGLERSRRATAMQANELDSDLGEEAPLTEREAAEKAQRRKSLRFYTSQIANKANKRGAAGRNAGGDDDVPHRERLRDRQARLNAEAEKRGRSKADPRTELGADSDEDDRQQSSDLRNAADDDDDYYDFIAAKAAKKKSDKAAFAAVQKQAELEGGRVVQEETVDPDGKRKITYAIEKNKGLTPHRKKDNRNPRVKKRKKFEEKKKKLSSMKPVYKGGEGRGGYGGELTGIKTGLVKSTKL